MADKKLNMKPGDLIQQKLRELAQHAAHLMDADGDGKFTMRDVKLKAAGALGMTAAFLEPYEEHLDKEIHKAVKSLTRRNSRWYALLRPIFSWPVLVALLLAMVAGAVFLAPRDSLPTTAGLAGGGAIAARLEALEAGQIRIMATSQATAAKVDDMAALIDQAKRMKPAERKSWAEDFFGGLR